MRVKVSYAGVDEGCIIVGDEEKFYSDIDSAIAAAIGGMSDMSDILVTVGWTHGGITVESSRFFRGVSVEGLRGNNVLCGRIEKMCKERGIEFERLGTPPAHMVLE